MIIFFILVLNLITHKEVIDFEILKFIHIFHCMYKDIGRGVFGVREIINHVANIDY